MAAASRLGTDAVVASGAATPSSEGNLSAIWLATVFDGRVESFEVTFPADRNRLRQYATITVLNALRLRLLGSEQPEGI